MKPISSPLAAIQPHYDVLVIGSGYGGSIAASRMARAGKSVCLLERGREFLTGEFPDTELEAAGELQFNSQTGHKGSHLGLFDIHMHREQNVVVGCGLGGTSLINANVALPPVDAVLRDPVWPHAIRDDEDGLLEEGFSRAREMLKPALYPEHYPTLNKLKAHQQSATALEAPFNKVPINVCFAIPEGGINHVGVEQQACNNCGDCVSGCNFNAKNTTRMNYLPDAWNHGAEIYCQASVRYLEKIDSGWRVFYQDMGTGAECFSAAPLFVEADIVILAAGTLGSNEILLRSQSRGLAISSQLGQHFTGNGDMLGFGYNCDSEIGGVGVGNLEPEGKAPTGPCITSAIDLREASERAQQMIIEEGSLPGAMAGVLPTALASVAGVAGLDTDHGFYDALEEQARVWQSQWRGAYHGAVKHTQTYLVMSHDDSQGVITLEQDKLNIRWPELGAQPNFHHASEKLLQATAALGGTYVKNPIWSPWLNNRLVTVHPLGGCRLAETGSEGVVNHKGQVFTGESDACYDSLYVSDGAIIPTSLAVNPLLTISALTERCCALIAKDRDWQIDYQLPSSRSRSAEPTTTGLAFTERMQGYFSRVVEPSTTSLQTYLAAYQQGQETNQTLSFVLTVTSTDLEVMLTDPQHKAHISGRVECNLLSDKPLTVRNGEFRLFERQAFPPNTRKMIYKMNLMAEDGKQYFFNAFKLIKDDPHSLDLWDDTTTLFVDIHEGEDTQGAVCGHGIMKIAPIDFVTQLATIRVSHADSKAARLKAIARFGQFFAGTLYQSYGSIFYQEKTHSGELVRKKRPLRAPTPEVYLFDTADHVQLSLTRYRGGDKGPVMLVHGLGVASSIFSTDMIDTNLVEYLVANQYDVWLLDYRVSILLPAAAKQSNGDQVAKYDYPAAVNKIRTITGADSIQAVVHCYGATTFFMSMLRGLSGVRSVVASQIAADVVVPMATKMKTGLHLPSFLERLGVDSLTARVPQQSNGLASLYDKALGLYALAEAQGRCNNDSCHRVTFMYASLYRHDQLTDLLHEHIDELFAEANIQTLEHLAAICRAGKLVDADGKDVYMPHINRLNVPTLFISGADNECYLPESTKKTYERLCHAFGDAQFTRKVIPNYAHIDCIFGRQADVDVFPHILNHLERY
ncbi:GMC family oxidoreductase N-terminal domain-containing protein [Pseudoalteromonas piscicida]|uniref:GMC family oxidoreductase N-terminal domain-containing protein n=1 Tax=Pseudoalteromonas piscicida TaxID=43662 RepID=UPI001EFE6514|nr:GMC oxidoreductase [Pseudoalteromonas piscicida]MCG9768349.1 GMC family oxidoreductase N-terminal domain-containing protein [Pseudoalteromonas piscicida]